MTGRLILWALAVIGAVLTFTLLVPLPRLFPASDGLIAAGLGFSLFMGGAMMWPSRWLWSESQRTLYWLTTQMNVSPDRAQMALKVYGDATDAADRLRKSDNGFADDLSKAVKRTANQLDRLGLAVLETPDQTRAALPLITRADLLVQAAQSHAALRRKTKNADSIAQAREKLTAAIDAFEGAVATHENRAIAEKLADITATTNVATSLFQRMEGPRS